MLKDAAVIAGITGAVITGAITGIVGGAMGISIVSALLHYIMGQ